MYIRRTCGNYSGLFYIWMYLLVSTLLLLGCAGSPNDTSQSAASQPSTTNQFTAEEEFTVVDCLLPGQIRRLGTQVTYVTPRRPTRTTAQDCSIRGGEYVASDRADYSTALNVWLAEAKKGDPQAQYYVATIYEKGLNGTPDYAQAADWYRKAAAQGFDQAAINLGRLYEKGFGVPSDSDKAFNLYAKASGLDEAKLAMLIQNETMGKIRTLERTLATREGEIGSLQQKLQSVNQQLAESRAQLQQHRERLNTEQQKFLDTKQRYQTLQAELQQARQRPDQTAAIAQYERDVQSLKTEMVRRQESLQLKDRQIASLTQRIEELEEEVRPAPQGLQTASVVDLGFEGPKIEIIDPPLLRTRGISVTKDVMSLAVKLKTSKRITGRVLAPAGLQRLSANGQPLTVNDNMIFTVDLPMLHSGEQAVPVEILAIDTQNKRGTYRLMVTPANVRYAHRCPRLLYLIVRHSENIMRS